MVDMRVLFTTTGHSGHLLPLAPVAHATAGAGHEVAIATQASRVPAVERMGLPALPLAEAPDAAWAPLMRELARAPNARPTGWRSPTASPGSAAAPHCPAPWS